ncbi:hypothetical protein CcCBS67573_g09520 [Chytriomyces confervae]|uniref:Homeobox domain-containing protein n=1 Tax=Chytriomyces confervae TaxID=246404 RepID=A0A507DUL2_9FUNG|nr:hypothetical protein CcCBS67573_g09520 [Chytriomyces confervae]
MTASNNLLGHPLESQRPQPHPLHFEMQLQSQLQLFNFLNSNSSTAFKHFSRPPVKREHESTHLVSPVDTPLVSHNPNFYSHMSYLGSNPIGMSMGHSLPWDHALEFASLEQTPQLSFDASVPRSDSETSSIFASAPTFVDKGVSECASNKARISNKKARKSANKTARPSATTTAAATTTTTSQHSSSSSSSSLPRFRATELELQVLSTEFDQNPFPTCADRQRIAATLGMNTRQVQFW